MEGRGEGDQDMSRNMNGLRKGKKRRDGRLLMSRWGSWDESFMKG